MKILGLIRWLQIRLHVLLVSKDGVLLGSPGIYLAFSEYDQLFYGYRVIKLYRREIVMQNTYIYAPLSKYILRLSSELISPEGLDKWCDYRDAAKNVYGCSEKWLEDEFNCEFYRWPFWACGSNSNIYKVSIDELDALVSRCILRVNRAKNQVNPFT